MLLQSLVEIVDDDWLIPHATLSNERRNNTEQLLIMLAPVPTEHAPVSQEPVRIHLLKF